MSNEKPYLVIRSLSNPSALTGAISEKMFRAKRRLIMQRRKERGKDANLAIPDGIPEFAHVAQMAAVQDLLRVIAHVRKLFAGKFAKKNGLIDILNDFELAVFAVELGVIAHGFPNLGDTEKYEEIGLLEDKLTDHEYFEISVDGAKGELLSSLTNFWLNEIRCRVADLVELLTN